MFGNHWVMDTTVTRLYLTLVNGGGEVRARSLIQCNSLCIVLTHDFMPHLQYIAVLSILDVIFICAAIGIATEEVCTLCVCNLIASHNPCRHVYISNGPSAWYGMRL